MSITINELAKLAGVSVATVSRALTNGSHRVNENTRRRIVALAEEQGYRPNLIARGLRTDRTLTIGIIVNSIISPFSPSIIRGIQDHLQEHQYFSVIINADGDPETEKSVIHDLISRSVDGVIFVESWLRGANPTLDLADKPYVFAHRLFNHSVSNSVVVDDQYGTQLAMEHLAKLGHQRIAFIGGPSGWSSTGDRLKGYRESLELWGLPYDPALEYQGNWELQSGLAAARTFLNLPEKPTAIFAANDLMALGAIYGIQEIGLRVPDDIAVVGYDDREIAALTRPTITTVVMPCYELGQAASSMLLRLIEKRTNEAEVVIVKGSLVVRESSGAPEGKIPLDQFQTHTTPRPLTERPE